MTMVIAPYFLKQKFLARNLVKSIAKELGPEYDVAVRGTYSKGGRDINDRLYVGIIRGYSIRRKISFCGLTFRREVLRLMDNAENWIDDDLYRGDIYPNDIEIRGATGTNIAEPRGLSTPVYNLRRYYAKDPKVLRKLNVRRLLRYAGIIRVNEIPSR